jgi:hypothetical protein
MRRHKYRHIVIGDPHPDCPLCQLQAAGESPEDAGAASVETHPAECPCRFCRPATSPYVAVPLKPWEDEIIDVAVGQDDGSLRVTASYRVERDGSMTWLTGPSAN